MVIDARARVTRWGAVLALAISGALIVRILAIGKPGVAIILVPAIAGGLLAYRRPDSRMASIAAAALVVPSAVVLLLGYVGLAYVPSIVLLVASALRREHAPA